MNRHIVFLCYYRYILEYTRGFDPQALTKEHQTNVTSTDINNAKVNEKEGSPEALDVGGIVFRKVSK